MPHTHRRSLRVLALTVALGAAGAPPAPASGQDADAVWALIDHIRASMRDVTVDGLDREWAPVPAIPDPTGDAERSAVDLTYVSVLPTDSAVLIRLTTAAPPDPGDRVYWVDLDVVGGRLPDVQFGLDPDGRHWARLFDSAGRPRALRRVRFPAAVRDVVEMAIPMTLLADLLDDDQSLTGPEARPWVRAVAFSYDRATRTVHDVAAAASYRVTRRRYALDLEADGPTVRLPLPVGGRWLVSQGPFGYATHAGVRAWDLTRTDNALRASDPPGSCDNQEFLAWDEPVRAPAAARLLEVDDGSPDEPACGRPSGQEPNAVLLGLVGTGERAGRLRLTHLRRGSVVARRGETVGPGALLGRVGNSGPSVGPHLHVEVHPADDVRIQATVRFENVRVSLNAVVDDPWARSVDAWVPRPGLFVESATGRPQPPARGTRPDDGSSDEPVPSPSRTP